jgi:hypothetical protein
MKEKLIVDPQEKVEYLEKHLPYRINSLLAHDLMLLRKERSVAMRAPTHPYSDSLVVEPMFEISLVFGRSLLHFLGVDSDGAGSFRHPTRRNDDVSIKSLFPDRDYCAFDDLELIKHKDAIVALLKSANKSVAHLTSLVTDDVDQSVFPEARLAVYRLMLKKVPEINREKIWWYKQVETTL